MSFVGPFIMEMGDQEYWAHLEKCNRLSALLSKAIDDMMHYIFEGRCTDSQQWEMLFYGLNQAVLIKGYLTQNCSNLLTIAEDFMSQIEEWHRELQQKHN